jgi:hypothetical protein
VSLRAGGGREVKGHVFLLGLLAIAILSTGPISTLQTGCSSVRQSLPAITAATRHEGIQPVESSESRYSTTIVLGNVTWTATTIPSGYYYNFQQIQTPYGPGCCIDSIGKPSSEYNYNFLAYTNADYLVGPKGSIEVCGYFRQNDTFPAYLQPGRRQRAIYVMYSDNTNAIAVSVAVLNYTDGTGWHYKDIIIGGLTPNATVKVGVGTLDPYATDWNLEVDWAGVQVLYTSASGPNVASNGTGGGSIGFPSNDVLLAVPALFVLLLIIGFFVARKEPDESYGQNEATGSPTEGDHILPEDTTDQELPSPPISTPIACPECGAPVRLSNAVYCTRCGARLQEDSQQTPAQAPIQELGETCMVCRRSIRVGEETLRCPYCRHAAHSDHFLEWIHVKDSCPFCGSHLNEEELHS